MGIAAQLAAARHARGLTAIELGGITGLQPSNIYSIERGRRQARIATLESLAAGLGVRFVLVDTWGRASAAEIATQIKADLDNGDSDGAARLLLQLANSLRAATPLARVALTQDPPPPVSPQWDAAIAGIAEWMLAGQGTPLPNWVVATTGDPTWHWSPWGTPGEGSYLFDSDEVPEPLQRRGILVEAGELDAA